MYHCYNIREKTTTSYHSYWGATKWMEGEGCEYYTGDTKDKNEDPEVAGEIWVEITATGVIPRYAITED